MDKLSYTLFLIISLVIAYIYGRKRNIGLFWSIIFCIFANIGAIPIILFSKKRTDKEPPSLIKPGLVLLLFNFFIIFDPRSENFISEKFITDTILGFSSPINVYTQNISAELQGYYAGNNIFLLLLFYFLLRKLTLKYLIIFNKTLLTILAFCYFILLWGCGKTDSRNIKLSKEEESQMEQKIKENANRIDSVESARIISKYNANSTWDTLSFTYQLQENLVEKNELASLKADLLDIIKKDTSYYVKLLYKQVIFGRSSNFNDIRLFLKISQNQLSLLKSVHVGFENSLGLALTGLFIFKAKDISNYNEKVLDSNFNELTGESSAKENDSNILLIKGDLIDFYLFKN